MKKQLDNFFNWLNAKRQSCEAEQEALNEAQEEIRILKRDLYARNEQTIALIEQVKHLNISIIALEKEIEILNDVIRVQDKPRPHRPFKKQPFVAKPEISSESNGKKDQKASL